MDSELQRTIDAVTDAAVRLREDDAYDSCAAVEQASRSLLKAFINKFTWSDAVDARVRERVISCMCEACSSIEQSNQGSELPCILAQVQEYKRTVESIKDPPPIISDQWMG